MANKTKVLRVRAVSGMSPNLEHDAAGRKQFIGRKLVKSEDAPNGNGFELTNEVEELPVRAEYLLWISEGHLVPADAETARLAGIPFEEPKKSAAPPRPAPPSPAPDTTA